MENLTELESTYAEDLIPGARNAVRTCLRVTPGEQVVLITDLETEEIAASLADQVREVGAGVDVHVMEDYGLRPMLALPASIRQALERADVSIYAGQPKSGELAFRRELTQVIDRRQIRVYGETGGDMKKVVDYICDETSHGLGLEGLTPSAVPA